MYFNYGNGKTDNLCLLMFISSQSFHHMQSTQRWPLVRLIRSTAMSGIIRHHLPASRPVAEGSSGEHGLCRPGRHHQISFPDLFPH
jgi:hypothetical protein